MCFNTDTQQQSAINSNLIGDSFLLTYTAICPYIEFEAGDKGIAQIGDTCGTFEATADGIKVDFESQVIAQCGTCIKFELFSDESCGGDDEGCDPKKAELTDETKLAVLDEKGCPAAYITIAELKEALKDDEDCDLGEPISAITPGTYIVGSTDGCNRVLIDPDAVKCDPQPEPFDCGNE